MGEAATSHTVFLEYDIRVAADRATLLVVAVGFRRRSTCSSSQGKGGGSSTSDLVRALAAHIQVPDYIRCAPAIAARAPGCFREEARTELFAVVQIAMVMDHPSGHGAL